MRHTFYALFPGTASATAAVRELDALGVETMSHHRHMDSEQLEMSETNAMPRLVTGIVLGVIVGPLLVLAVMSVAGLPISTPALLLGAVLGGLFCGLGGVLIGSASPDSSLEKLAATASPDEVLLTITASRYSDQEAAEAIVHRHEGTISQRGVVTANKPEAHHDQDKVAVSQESRWEGEGGNVPSVPTPRTDVDAPRR
jgi:hypothetical protein